MGYYNINFLNYNERECLDTVLIPYGLYVMNKELPTRVVGTSKSLIDYFITDLLKSETFETHVSDTPFRTSKNKPIDHRATIVSKTKYMICSRGKNRKQSTIYINRTAIERVDKFCNPGVMIKYNHTFQAAMKNNVDKAKEALFKLDVLISKIDLEKTPKYIFLT